MTFVNNLLEKLETDSAYLEQFANKYNRYINTIESALKDLDNSVAKIEYEKMRDRHKKIMVTIFGEKGLNENFTPSVFSLGRISRKAEKYGPQLLAECEEFSKKYNIMLGQF